MELTLGKYYVLLLSLFSLACLVSSASMSPAAYWKLVLPNTPIPEAIKESLPHADLASEPKPLHRSRTTDSLKSGDNYRSLLPKETLRPSNGYGSLLSYKPEDKDRNGYGTIMLSYKPEEDKDSNGYGTMLSYKPEEDKDSNGYGTMLSYKPEKDKDSNGYGTMLSYKPEEDKDSNGYGTMLSYKPEDKDSNGYGTMLSYKPEEDEDSNGYGTMLTYKPEEDKDSNGYGTMLSYKPEDKDSNGYGTMLSYKPEEDKDSNGYGTMLTYKPEEDKDSNGYGTMLSYKPEEDKDSNGYGTMLSYKPEEDKDSNGYGTFLSYKRKEDKDSNGYGTMLSYKPEDKDSNGYGTMLSYKPEDSLKESNGYGSLLSYKMAKGSLRSLSGYLGLLSYSKRKLSSLALDGPSPPEVSADAEKYIFLEKDLQVGTKKNLHFNMGTRNALFLPRDVADNIPFSSTKLKEIFKILSVDPMSKIAHIIKKRIDICEEPTMEGIEKQCLTSLESTVDFVTSKIGNNVTAISWKLERESGVMEYTITQVKKLTDADRKTVVCHKMDYPYAVMFCHTTKTIRSYMVSLKGQDGSPIEAVAVCHRETNVFVRNYAINVLKVKPGSIHICHFPSVEDTLIWVAA